MVYTIRPPVRWPGTIGVLGGWLKAMLFLMGAIAGAASVAIPLTAMGAWIGLGGTALGRIILCLTAVCLAAADFGFIRAHLPTRHHQVSRNTILKHPWLGALPYGYALGTGFWTYVSVSLPYFLLLYVLVSGEIRSALWAAAGFALGRAAPIAGWAFVRELPDDRFASWVEQWELGRGRTASGIVLAAFVVHFLSA